MAEYFPLLSRAVAGLRDAPAEQRHAIYDRARQALLGQLRSMRPAVPDEAIDRESVALDEAIARIEAEIDAAPAGKPAVSTLTARREPTLAPQPKPIPARPGPIPPPLAQPPAVPEATPASATPAQPAAPAPQTVASPAASEAPVPSEAPSPAGAPAPAGAPGNAPAAPDAPAAPARVTVRPAAPSGQSRPGAGEAVRPAIAVQPRPPAPPLVPPPTLRAQRGEEPGAALPSAPRLQVATAPKIDDGTFDAAMAEAAAAADVPETAPRDDAMRPAAPRPVRREKFNPRFVIVVAVAGLVIAGIAYTAWRLRDKPEALARSRAAQLAAQQAEPQPGKIVSRADGSAPAAVVPPAASSAAVVTAPAATPAPAPDTNSAPSALADQAVPAASGTGATMPDAGSTAAATTPVPPTAATQPIPAPSSPVTATATCRPWPVAQRAALLVDAPDDPRKVKTYVGTIVWRTESVSPGQNLPLATAVRAEIDVPDANLKLSVLLQKNAEAQFPASHTMELRFIPQGANPLGGVKQINMPLMRKDDSDSGDPLIGLPVTITENYFLVGLSRGNEAIARNIELIKSRNWFDIPMLLGNGKVAKMTFEKGATGQQVIDQAIQAWQ